MTRTLLAPLWLLLGLLVCSALPRDAQAANPVVSSFSPTTGGAGTSVTITGSNFTGATAVYFNSASASFTVNTSSQITATVPNGAATGRITVYNATGSGTASVDFLVPVPTITSFSPTSGAAGTFVTITGTNFTGTTNVYLNGIVTTFVVNSATSITAPVPTGAATGRFQIYNPAGDVTAITDFTVPAPAITSFSPTSGVPGTTVTLTGTNFSGATGVYFNNVSATSFTVNSATSITATVPPGAATGRITVYAPTGNAGSLTDFTVAKPTITSFSPTSGAAGTTVTLTGTNFTGATAVDFNGYAATSFTVNSATSLTVTVPPSASTGRITVYAPSGNGISLSNYTVPVPTITSFTATSGQAGATVVITGTNFAGATSLTFNGAAASSFTINSSTQITATVPNAATTGRIVIYTPAGSGSSLTDFTVPLPTITSFSPTSGSVGTSVTLTGNYFNGTYAVYLNGVLANHTVNSNTQLTVVVPSGATTGRFTVYTTAGYQDASVDFRIGALPAANISSFSPTSGIAGTTVTITGAGFSGASSVQFNGYSASFTLNSSTSITATVPSAASTGRIRVYTGPNDIYSAADFTVPKPTISSFTPTSGLANTSVTITGTNFTGATAVYFGGYVATFTVNSSTSITASVPVGASTGRVVVVTPAGSATTSNDFTVSAPTITSFTPTSGLAGTSVTITGTNYTGALAVYFGGVTAAFTVNSTTSITATVPASAATGALRITTPGGDAYSNTDFTVPKPTISSFSPTSGQANASVTITGANFSGATEVYFNGWPAAFTVNSNTSITATVPAGASTGRITIFTAAGSGASSNDFTVPIPTVTSFTPGSGQTNTSVTITGTAFNGTTDVQFNGWSASFTVNSNTSITAVVPTDATSGRLRIISPAGSSYSGTDFIVPVPVITSFTPMVGPVGASVVITGNYFTNAYNVQFNGTTANFVVNSNTQLTATVPSGATTGRIYIGTPAGGVYSAADYTVGTAPGVTVASFSPTSGCVGTSVTITGTGFTGATAVKFNGTNATSYTVNSATQITATVPAGATTGPVSVTASGGTGASASSFTVLGTPTVTSLSPTSGAVGTSVTITGTNFTAATGVSFNNVVATTFTVNSATSITTTVPSGATTGTVRVTGPCGTGTSSGSFTVTATAAPTITSFTPTSGAPGTVVTITGTNFTGATVVKFNTKTAIVYTVVNSTTITATVPALGITGKLSVTTPGGTATSSASFTVAPIITSFTPGQGSVGSVVIVTGLNFVSGTVVRFNGTSATTTYNSATQLTATVPSSATTGALSVTATAGTTSSATNYTITTGAAPTITSFTPTSGVQGTTVTITGTNFTGATAVRFNNTTTTSLTVVSSTQITVAVPVSATTGLVYVVTPNGMAKSATNFTVTLPPTITTLAPSSGSPGAYTLLTGTNFTNVSGVTFSGVPATSYTVLSATSISARIPAGAVTGRITVTNTAGTGVSGTDFTVTADPAPTITSFAPASGVRGSTVTVTGTNLLGVTAVKIGAIAVTSYSVNAARTQLTFVVPSTAVTGTLYLTAEGGMAQSATSYTVILAPTITSFTPTSGPVGTLVTISGTNYAGITGVAFGGVAATSYTVVSTVKITATVPAGAVTGAVTVTNAAGTATKSTFTVTTSRITDEPRAARGAAPTGTTAEAELALWPNPASEIVNLTGPAGAAVRLFDATGRLVRTATLTEGTTRLDVRGLPGGLYTVRVGEATRRLVVGE